MGDRIVVMKDGSVAAGRNAARRLPAPGQHLRGRIHRQSGDEFLQRHAGGIRRAPGCSRRAHSGLAASGRSWPGRDKLGAWINREVVLGLRPEDIRDADLHPERATECCLEATIDVVEMMGNEAFLNGSIGEHDLVARVESETRGRSDGAPHRSRLRLCARAHLFDPATSAAVIR